MRFSTSLFVVLFAAPFVWASPVESAVHIKLEQADGHSCGSGTVVATKDGKSLIVSAAHVVSDPVGKYTVTLKNKEYSAKYAGGSKVTLRQIKPNETQMTIEGPDLALLVVDVELPIVTLAKDGVKEGDKVRMWGYAGGKISKFGALYKEGYVVNPNDIWATADARRGDSGSGLFNNSDQMVGLVHSRSADDDEPGSLSIPIDVIRSFLKDKAKDWKIE